jgi:hypothetical protein
MKTRLLHIACAVVAVMCFAYIALYASPGVYRQPVIRWTPASDAYTLIYSRTNLASGQWNLLVQMPPGASNYTITSSPGIRFYALTSSNMWGESPFSETVQTPSEPIAIGRLLTIE